MMHTVGHSAERIGGLSKLERAKFFRLQRQLRDAATNCYMRINDRTAQSFRSRTLSAKKMAEISQQIYRLLART